MSLVPEWTLQGGDWTTGTVVNFVGEISGTQEKAVSSLER